MTQESLAGEAEVKGGGQPGQVIPIGKEKVRRAAYAELDRRKNLKTGRPSLNKGVEGMLKAALGPDVFTREDQDLPSEKNRIKKERVLRLKIDAEINSINQLHADQIDRKAGLALKNKRITPEQHKRLIDLKESGDILRERFRNEEITDGLLTDLSRYKETLIKKIDATIPDHRGLPTVDLRDKEFKGGEDKEGFKKKAAEKRFKTKETEPGLELARLGAQITLHKINDYKELWAETEQDGDKKFNKKTRELWKEFAVHGVIGKDKGGKTTLLNFSDLDGKSSLGLLRLAGIKTGDVTYVNQGEHVEGRINVDTGKRHGIVLEDEGKTVFIDHHADNSGKDSSATKFTYELLVSLGLLKKEAYLDELVKFVTQLDNKTFPEEEKYFKNSWRTILGLDQFLNFKSLETYFREGRKPTEILSEDDIKKIGGKELFKNSQKQKEKVENSLAELKRMDENGLAIPSERYGKIAVDIEKKVSAGFDAAKAVGCGAYIIWSPQENSFFITSTKPLNETFKQGFKVRDNMWMKPRTDGVVLSVKLGADILSPMTDGQFQPVGELAEFINKEEGQLLSLRKIEIFEKFGQEFYDVLKENASWEGYDEKNRLMKLEIQTKVFLTKQLKKSKLAEDDKAAEIVESLFKKINK